MTRAEAEEIVHPFIQRVGGYSVVSTYDATELLGDDGFWSLCHDPLRKQQPMQGYWYAWNVIDHLLLQQQGAPNERRAS